DRLPCQDSESRSIGAVVDFAGAELTKSGQIVHQGVSWTLETLLVAIDKLHQRTKGILSGYLRRRTEYLEHLRDLLEADSRSTGPTQIGGHPYIAVRTDTALPFINNVMEARSAAEIPCRFNTVFLTVCILFVILNRLNK
ncbi:unnamed protein product, partial [Callosobruchus maculatus]